jgi:glycosyltransferase involved in cell wall biosynthesis
MSIRVLHVITTLGRGGAERQLVNLVCNTRSDEFEHLVCYLNPPGDFEGELKDDGHTVTFLDVPNRWPWVFAPFRLIPALRKHKPDIIQTWLLEADLAARLSTLAKPIPIINTLHLTTYEPETIRQGGWPRWKLAVFRQLDRLTARLTKPLFVAVSETVRKSAINQLHVPAKDVRLIYNSINQETLRSEPGDSVQLRAQFGIPENGFVFVNVGRMAPQKGQSYLIHAFAKVANEHPNTYLAFVGDGPLHAELVSIATTLGISDRVKFLGRREDVGACLELGDAFVFPSLFEGLPLAPIEAMLKGLPCIGTRIGPMQEIVTHRENGLLVAHGSVDELAAAMSELYLNPELRQRLAASAKRLAFERFDSGMGLKAWEQLYREVARGGGRNGTGKAETG